MSGGMTFEQSDIVLIPFPYSDLSTVKQRPGLIISNNSLNVSEDLLLCAITSNPEPSKFGIIMEQKDLEDGTLNMTSKIRPEKIITLHKNKIIKRFGKLNKNKTKEVIDKINEIIALENWTWGTEP